MNTRVIPVLLLKGKGLYKTIKFKDPSYVGDPINSVRILNEKEVDEIALLDIAATREGRGPDFSLLADIAGEAFMPMSYGGGVSTKDHIKTLFGIGFEKVILNTAIYDNHKLVENAVNYYGSQSVVASVDVRRSMLGSYILYSNSGAKKIHLSLTQHLKTLEQLGVGEILVNSIDRDGTRAGYDLELIKEVTKTANVPVIACGGARGMNDFAAAVSQAGASAVAAGSLFVYHGPHRAVLINYPDRTVLESMLP